MGLTDSELAGFFNCGRTTILNYRKKFGLPSNRESGERGLGKNTIKAQAELRKDQSLEDRVYSFQEIIKKERRYATYLGKNRGFRGGDFDG